MAGNYKIEMAVETDDFARGVRKAKDELNEVTRAAERETARQRQLAQYRQTEAKWTRQAQVDAFNRLSVEDRITKLRERQAIIAARLARSGQSELVMAGYKAKQAETSALLATLMAQKAAGGAAGGGVAAAGGAMEEETFVKRALHWVGLGFLVKWAKKRGVPLTGGMAGGAAALAGGYMAASSTAQDASAGADMPEVFKIASQKFAQENSVKQAISYGLQQSKYAIGAAFSVLYNYTKGAVIGLFGGEWIPGNRPRPGVEMAADALNVNQESKLRKEASVTDDRINLELKYRRWKKDRKEAREQFDLDLAAMNKAERETMDVNWAAMEAEREKPAWIAWSTKYLGQFSQQDQGGLARMGMYSQAGGANYAQNTVTILNEQVRLQRMFLVALQDLNRKIEAAL